MQLQKLHSYALVAIIWAYPFLSVAQTDVEEERSSLAGLEGVGFTINVEQNTAFADTQLVDLSVIRNKSLQTLNDADIRIYSDKEVEESIQIPVLYVHVNSLSTKTGIVSFGVTINLYQPVKLMLRDDKQATASTWETSTVGIASYDKMSVIEQAAVGLVKNFINDFKEANKQ